MQRILAVAVVALSINAIVGFAGIGRASGKQPLGRVKVISAIQFQDVEARPFKVRSGSGTYGSVHCPAHTIVVSGGYLLWGGVSDANPPSVIGSSRTGSDSWRINVDNPPTGGDATVSAFATCATITYTSVRGS